jgi:uncharacterized membrane protein YebE (DUF533 family)
VRVPLHKVLPSADMSSRGHLALGADMSVKSFLDNLLQQGKALAQKGEDLAADKLGFDDSEADRKKLRNTALAGGLIGLLLGSRGARRLAGTAAVVGGIGYLGKLAYDSYTGKEAQAPGIDKLDGAAAEKRAIAITSAIIAAARADGQIDDREDTAIQRGLSSLPDDVAEMVSAQLTRPLDAHGVAALADSEQAAREMYAASVLVTGGDTESEKAYLADLATALKLAPEVVAEVHARVQAA